MTKFNVYAIVSQILPDAEVEADTPEQATETYKHMYKSGAIARDNVGFDEFFVTDEDGNEIQI
jgi:hypothetical protein